MFSKADILKTYGSQSMTSLLKAQYNQSGLIMIGPSGSVDSSSYARLIR